MATLLIMYDRPFDSVAFDMYYIRTHVHIFAKAPGIRTVTFSRSPIKTLVGSTEYYLVVELTFDSLAAIEAALASDAGQAAAADLANFAGAGVTIVAFDTRG